MKEIIKGNIRVQFYKDDIIRIEYGKRGNFCDTSTFFIPSRDSLEDDSIEVIDGDGILFSNYRFVIPENAKSLKGVKLYENDELVYTYKKIKNSGELPSLDKTPKVFPLVDSPRIIIPVGGYSKDRVGEYEVTENVSDIYLLLCHGDFKKLREQYVGLTGKSELVRLSTLGVWNSKYYAYNEDEAKQVIKDHQDHNYPLDVLVIDTDWRTSVNGWGYDINTNLFPDMKRFLDHAHQNGVEVMFNDHPEPCEGQDVFGPMEIRYRESNLKSFMELGLDIWWYDRNWTTHLISPTPNVAWETFGLYLFQDITEQFYKTKSIDEEVYRRPVIMGNAVNVQNGNYMGISDSASHRYSIQWTGDISSMPSFLSQEVANLVKCGNNAIPYINADCGGHMGDPDKELFIRWMQFGTLSPIFRPHCSNSVIRTREAWNYDEETTDIVREYVNLRYRLLPVIYKSAFNSYMTGEPIFKSLGWNYPHDEKALRLQNEYMLGNDILISPIGGEHLTMVKESNYSSKVKATYYIGRKFEGRPIVDTICDSINLFCIHTSPHEGVPVYDYSTRFITTIKFKSDVILYIKCDDGATVWLDDVKVLEDDTLHSAQLFKLGKLVANREYNLRIDYFQAGGEACCQLLTTSVKDDQVKKVYLPNGQWLDVFNGKIHKGNNSVSRKYSTFEFPIFVKLGSLIPLAHVASNTRNQKWNQLTFDFYPSHEGKDSDYLYEDDTETTAYKLGQYRTCNYEAYYDSSKNAHVIKLHKGIGEFSGRKTFKERDITIKYHQLNGEVKKVLINNNPVSFKVVKKDKLAFPLNDCFSALDSDVLIVNTKINIDSEYVIEFHI